MIKVNEELVDVSISEGSVVAICKTTFNNETERTRVAAHLQDLTEVEASNELNVDVIFIDRRPRPPPPFSPPQAPSRSLSLFAMSLLEELSISIAVMAGSFLIAIAIACWIKYSGANPGFKMILSLDVALAAMDFGSDTLFIVTAFSLGDGGDDSDGSSSDRAAGSSRPLAWASLIFLVVARTLSFLCCLKLVHHFFRCRSTNAADIDWEKFDSHSNLFGILAVFSSADIELIKLFPWRIQIYDGFPHMWVAMLVMGLTLLEDVPQLICQIAFVATVEPNAFAWVSIGITLLSIAWRVAKRSFKLMGAGAGAAAGGAQRDEGGGTSDLAVKEESSMYA